MMYFALQVMRVPICVSPSRWIWQRHSFRSETALTALHCAILVQLMPLIASFLTMAQSLLSPNWLPPCGAKAVMAVIGWLAPVPPKLLSAAKVTTSLLEVAARITSSSIAAMAMTASRATAHRMDWRQSHSAPALSLKTFQLSVTSMAISFCWFGAAMTGSLWLIQ